MKNLEFDILTLKNFMSVGSTPLTLNFKSGLNLITGYDKDKPEEKNGIGKSTICDGLFFALFNETVKDLKMSEIINDKNKKDCEVYIKFRISEGLKIDEYEIIRTLKPSNCIFKCNGIDISRSSIPQTNSEISKVLNFSKELAKQSIIMSIGKSVSFFNQSKVDKRKFIEGICNLGIFSEMLSDSRSGYNESKKEKEQVAIQLENENNRLNQFKEKHQSFESSKNQFIELLKSQIKQDLDKINKLKESLKSEESLTDLNQQLSDLNKSISSVDELRLKIQIKLSEINSDIKRLTDEIENCSDICFNCGRPFEDSDDRNKINNEKRKEIEKLSTLRMSYLNNKTKVLKKKDELDKKRDNVKVAISSAKNISDHNKTINSHIKTLSNSCLQNKEKIISKNKEVSEFEDLIVECESEIKSLDSEYKYLFRENKVYDFCKFILSEEGVKSEIIDKLKRSLNHKMNSYLDRLGSTLTCEFDEYFSETIYNKNGIEKSYDAFSGGEQKRIDLAILLTFQDILREQSRINIRIAFYDEILDSSICETGRKNVLKILKDRSEQGNAIYIISHRGKMSDLIDNEIVLEKHNDFTFLKEIK